MRAALRFLLAASAVLFPVETGGFAQGGPATTIV
jgi:hypothetical protein